MNNGAAITNDTFLVTGGIVRVEGSGTALGTATTGWAHPTTAHLAPNGSGTYGKIEVVGADSSSSKSFMAMELYVDGGVLAFTGEGELPFGTLAATTAELAFKNGGALEIADGKTVAVKSLTIGDRSMTSGTYTGAGGPAGAKVLANLTGTGVLSVRTSVGMFIIFR